MQVLYFFLAFIHLLKQETHYEVQLNLLMTHPFKSGLLTKENIKHVGKRVQLN